MRYDVLRCLLMASCWLSAGLTMAVAQPPAADEKLLREVEDRIQRLQQRRNGVEVEILEPEVRPMIAPIRVVPAQAVRRREAYLSLSVRSTPKIQFVMRMAGRQLGEEAVTAESTGEEFMRAVESRTTRSFLQLPEAKQLSAQQRGKLILAARGDAKRVLRAVQTWFEKYDSIETRNVGEVRRAMADIAQINLLVDKHIYGVDTLLTKVTQGALTTTQKRLLAESHADWLTRVGRRFKALTETQAQQIGDLLVQHCDDTPILLDAQAYGHSLLQAIDKEALNRILTPSEIAALHRVILRYESGPAIK